MQPRCNALGELNMPYVLIDSDKIKEFDPEGKLKTLPDDAGEKIERLEGHANKLLGEKKDLQLEFDEYKVDSKRKISELHNNDGGDSHALKSQLDDALGKIKGWEDKYNDLVEENKTKTLSSKAVELAGQLTTDKSRAELLKNIFASRLALDGDSFGVLDETGNQTISTIDELTSQVRTNYPFLVDGSKASGGDAMGGAGSASAPLKKFTEYSGSELSTLRKESPEQYEQIKNEHYATN